LNPLHSDHLHAAQSPIGLSLPGPLVGAVAIGLGSVDVPVPATVALVGMTWKFTKPVHVGDTIAARWRLNRKRDVENPQWGLVTWQVEVLGGDGEVKAQGEVSRLVARRQAASLAGELPPAKRRRRRRSSTAALPTPAAVPEVPDPAPADTPPPARRRRRGRRGGGGGGNGGNGGHPPEAVAVAVDPQPQLPAPAEAAAADPAEPGLGGVLKRIRRRRS
jgi:hypothetical protein